MLSWDLNKLKNELNDSINIYSSNKVSHDNYSIISIHNNYTLLS